MHRPLSSKNTSTSDGTSTPSTKPSSKETGTIILGHSSTFTSRTNPRPSSTSKTSPRTMSTDSRKGNAKPFLQPDLSPLSSPLAPPLRFQDEIKMSRMKMWYTHPNPPFPSALTPLPQSSGRP